MEIQDFIKIVSGELREKVKEQNDIVENMAKGIGSTIELAQATGYIKCASDVLDVLSEMLKKY